MLNVPDSDYINANYIKVRNNLRERERLILLINLFIKSDDSFGKTYIATQGPLGNTISDFWSMIWQEASQFILMITPEMENKRVKCCKYWPEKGQQVKYDDLFIKCIEFKEFDDYSLRELNVSNLTSVSACVCVWHNLCLNIKIFLS